uniref:Uncharacterized protein LOC101498178 isoform X1 n=1 Tax=Cicer arietinum TaxID=3827 RepID=A0A1S2Y4P3_CICAR|nr:uncharacterized protein LOC101498178 isoform X1 [Cicer arietinum]
MGVCDIVASNLTIIYVAVTAFVKAYGILNGRNYSGVFVVTVSTSLVALILFATLMMDLCRKFNNKLLIVGEHHPRTSHREMSCKGGICWHGVAERLPASQQVKGAI